ncbi:MAG: phosphonate ABC transporter, permease protein PhnE [Alphaproteobacteria bacterium]|nr:phosphonate ABC transporter, permease protein PhnE [Alphaproteobacteria bacterium]
MPAAAAPLRTAGRRALDLLVWGGLALVLIVGFRGAEIWRVGDLASGARNMATLGAEFVRPDFSDLGLYLGQMVLTLEMALWGSVLALILAVPLGLAGARNLAPSWLQQPARRLLDVLRSVPDLVAGALFVAAIGLGPLAGVLALALNTGGVLGKLFAEAVEAVDPGPVEGLRATGAAPLLVALWAVIPQVAPLWVSYFLYRFESNARSATVLSLIGAGGIGQPLFDAINAFAFDKASAIVIVILAAVTVVDLASQWIRARLI